MEGLRRVVLGIGLLLCLAHAGSAVFQCSRENFFGQTEVFTCPDDRNSNNIFCCGYGDNKYCCDTLIDEEFVEDFVEKLPTIIGVVIAVIIALIALCVVCCCCCPFCLLHKRRNRGTVHNPNTAEVSVMQPLQNQPPPAQGYPTQAPYPTQPGYAPQPAPYPAQPGYAPQPYPPQGYPPEQPPMYEKQQPPPYNPGY